MTLIAHVVSNARRSPEMREVHARGRQLRRALLAADYEYAEGLIDVFDRAAHIRSCHFRHDARSSRLWVRCSITELSYEGDSQRGRVTCADGRILTATTTREPRDIPYWLLLPASAPIWGRGDDGWRADVDRCDWSETSVRLPLRSLDPGRPDGFADVAWPSPYLTQLRLGDELYTLRDVHFPDAPN